MKSIVIHLKLLQILSREIYFYIVSVIIFTPSPLYLDRCQITVIAADLTLQSLVKVSVLKEAKQLGTAAIS